MFQQLHPALFIVTKWTITNWHNWSIHFCNSDKKINTNNPWILRFNLILYVVFYKCIVIFCHTILTDIIDFPILLSHYFCFNYLMWNLTMKLSIFCIHITHYISVWFILTYKTNFEYLFYKGLMFLHKDIKDNRTNKTNSDTCHHQVSIRFFCHITNYRSWVDKSE